MAINKVIYYGEVLVDMSQVSVNPDALTAGKTALDASGEMITGANPYEKAATDAEVGDQAALLDRALEALRGKAAGGGGEAAPVLQEKSVTPTKATQEITPDAGYDGLSKVTVGAIPGEYIVPMGEKSIGENGTHDVREVESVNVSVPAPEFKTQEKTVTPAAQEQSVTPDTGFDGLSKVTVSGDNNLVAGNIKSGVSIFGVDGSYEGSGGTGGGEDLVGALADRSITEFSNARCESIGHSAFRGCSKLVTINAPNATQVADYAFYQCSALTSLNLPAAVSIGQQVIYGCNKLKELTFPSVTTIVTNALRGAQYVEIVDLPKLTDIPTQAFYGCGGLKALVLRSETMVTLANTNAFTTCYRILGTKNAVFNPNSEKIGFFYVPAALIEDYKAADNWSNSSLVTQFRALEDYTVDGTITGALDESKI